MYALQAHLSFAPLAVVAAGSLDHNHSLRKWCEGPLVAFFSLRVELSLCLVLDLYPSHCSSPALTAVIVGWSQLERTHERLNDADDIDVEPHANARQRL